MDFNMNQLKKYSIPLLTKQIIKTKQMELESKRIFTPNDFLNRFYKDLEGHPHNKMFNLQQKWACEAFFVIPQCDSCLEIGCGPVINLAACASRKCQHIYLTDYSTECLDQVVHEMKKMSENAKESFWSERLELIAKLQGTKTNQVTQRLQQRFIACFRIDLTKDNILEIPYLQKVDVITTSLAIQYVAKDQKDYKKILGNVRKLLKSRRFFYMFGSLGETYYKVNRQKFPVIPLTQQLIKQTLVDLKFQILIFNAERHQNSQSKPGDVSNNQGFFSVLAKSLV